MASTIDAPDPRISRIGLGCSRIGSFNNPATAAETRALLEASFDMGVTLFDTSDVYGQGDSEREIGRFVAGHRDKAFVVTKAGKLFSLKMRLMRPLKPLLKPLMSARAGKAVTAQRGGNIAHDFSPGHLVRAAEASLKRLGVERVDGFLLHSPPPEAAGDPTVWDALARLKSSGKIDRYGVSCDDLACLEAALPMPGLSLLQLPYDVLAQVQQKPWAERLAAPGLVVLAREVIRMQPAIPASEAIRKSFTLPGVDCVLVGSSKPAHVRAAVEAAA